jgi:hypothetical protein
MRAAQTLFSLVAAALLASCGTQGQYWPKQVQPGQTADEVIQSMGQPTGRYTLPNKGTRLEFARGPNGRHTFMVDLDSSGRVASVDQVLTEANFGKIMPGDRGDQVLMQLGRPSERRRAHGNTELWQYRYRATFCQWFVITMNPDGRVRDSGYVPDPACDIRSSLSPARPVASASISPVM